MSVEDHVYIKVTPAGNARDFSELDYLIRPGTSVYVTTNRSINNNGFLIFKSAFCCRVCEEIKEEDERIYGVSFKDTSYPTQKEALEALKNHFKKEGFTAEEGILKKEHKTKGLIHKVKNYFSTKVANF